MAVAVTEVMMEIAAVAEEAMTIVIVTEEMIMTVIATEETNVYGREVIHAAVIMMTLFRQEHLVDFRIKVLAVVRTKVSNDKVETPVMAFP